MNTRNLRFRSNRVRDILALFHTELDPLYGPGEVTAFLGLLFEEYLGWDTVKLLVNKDSTIDQSDLLRFHWALEDLHRCRPIQHIIGHTTFCGCRIDVSPAVLIPRPETEEMVSFLVENGEWRTENGRVLDLCTGSGCIAIALKAAWPGAEVTAVDVSEAALEVARGNAERNNTPVNFLQADLLSPSFNIQHSTFNIIVSNPPYVMERERAQMQRNVLDYDPSLALFVPDEDPLRFYRVIAAIAQRHLTKEGLLAVEINETLGEETCALLRDHGLSPTLHHDFRGKARWLEARRLESVSLV